MSPRPFTFFFLASLTFLASCAQFEKAPETEAELSQDLASVSLNLNVERVVLPNGLTVLLAENPTLPIYSYYTFYDVGGRYEGEGTTGATHFLEHMMFKGSENYGPGMFDQFINNNGGSTNAYTSFDSTVYYQNMPKHTLEDMIKIEADRMRSILLIPMAFESERRVILEERKMRYENSPQGQLFQAMTQALYEGTPYGGSVIGSKEDVEGLDRDRMLEFHKTFYSPSNAVVVIVGDIDIAQTKNWIRRSFGEIAKNPDLESFKKEHNKSENYTFQAKLNREIRLYGQATRPLFLLVFKGVPLDSSEVYAMDILSSILGSGESSYLNQKYVVSDRPSLSSIYAANYSMRYSGSFFLGGELLSGTNLARFRTQLVRDMDKFCTEAIDERSLQKTKNQYLVGYYRELQTNAGMASFLGQRELVFGDYEHYKQELVNYNKVSLEDVQTACRKIFRAEEHLFLSVWDKHPRTAKE